MTLPYLFIIVCLFLCSMNFAICIKQFISNGDADVSNKAYFLATLVTLILYTCNVLQAKIN